jgi:hypothetical protein
MKQTKNLGELAGTFVDSEDPGRPGAGGIDPFGDAQGKNSRPMVARI